MIPQKEFYFLRHGQTDSNLNLIKVDHPHHILLNETGRSQALSVEPIIAELPIKTICYSPMLRAVETKEIVTSRLDVPEFEIPDLAECSILIWQEMDLIETQGLRAPDGPVAGFMEQVLKGFQSALILDAPVLIIAHGGVHKALCSILNITGHPWQVDHCVPVHFYMENGAWQAKKLV